MLLAETKHDLPNVRTYLVQGPQTAGEVARLFTGLPMHEGLTGGIRELTSQSCVCCRTWRVDLVFSDREGRERYRPPGLTSAEEAG